MAGILSRGSSLKSSCVNGWKAKQGRDVNPPRKVRDRRWEKALAIKCQQQQNLKHVPGEWGGLG